MDPLVLLTFIVVALLEVLIPLFAARYFIRRFKKGWAPFIFGATFFLLVQVLHTPLVLFTQNMIYSYLLSTFPDKVVALGVFAIILGLLAGLFEEIGRFLIFKYFFPTQKQRVTLDKENALVFGIGWGGVESIVIALLLSLTALSYIFAAPLTQVQVNQINESLGGKLTAEQLDAINKQNAAFMALTPLDILPGLFERIMTMTLHVAFTMMVFFAVVDRKYSLLALAIIYHALVDALAVFLGQTSGILAAEGAIFILALIGFLYVRMVWNAKTKSSALSP